MKTLLNNFVNILKKSWKHELISGSFFVFLGFIITSFFSFLFNLFLARSLSYSSYGEYSSLLSIYSLATIPAGSLGIVVVRFATSYFSRGESDKLSAFLKRNLLFWLLVSFAILLIYLLLIPFTSSFLKINDFSPIAILGASISISYVGISSNSFLQALTKFKSLSVAMALGSFTKLISGIALVMAGFNIIGATIAILLSPLVTLVVGLFPLKYLIVHKSVSKIELHASEMVKYGLPASFAILFLSSFISSDVLLVKHFFPATQAGYYGGLSLVGKVIFYFTGPIPMVMFPLLVRRESIGENIRNLLYLSLLLVLIPSVLITVFYFLTPDFTIKFFLGGRDYLKISPYLGLFGIFLSIYSLNNIVVNFFLSLKKTSVVYFVGLGALVQLLLIIVFHHNFNQVIFSSISSSIFLLLILLIYYMKVYGFYNSSE